MPPPDAPAKINKTRRGGMFPKSLKACIEPVTKPAFKVYGLAGARIVGDWAQIVGPDIAKHASPAGIRFPAKKTVDGTLTILVTSAYALELQHLQPYILEKLASYFGYRAINRIQLTQTGKPLPREIITPPPLPTKPASADARRGITTAIESVQDEGLRAALASLEATVFGS